MSATRGYPPSPALHNYVTEAVHRRLYLRARAQRYRRPDPGYQCRTHLMRINRDVIEATVVVIRPERTRCVAIRLERDNRIWKAADLTIV
jgi:hypothetical protein